MSSHNYNRENDYQEYQPKKVFGYYRCNCKSKWLSAWTWEGFYQKCKHCGKKNYPYKTEELQTMRWASFYCQCHREWTDFIYAGFYNQDENQTENNEYYDNQYYQEGEEYYENNEYYDNQNYQEGEEYYENNEYYDNQYYLEGEEYTEIRYDLDPQKCNCGEMVYPTISYEERYDYHRKDLCQKCESLGNCTKYY